MRKLALILIVLWSCKKDDSKPAPAPTPTPVPVVKNYELNLSVKPAAYTQTASPFNAFDNRDSSYFTVKINGNVAVTDQRRSTNENLVFTDSVKTGDKIWLSIRMITYTQNAKESIFRLNKAWLMSPEVILSPLNIDTIPVIYSSGVGQSSKEWEFIAP